MTCAVLQIPTCTSSGGGGSIDIQEEGVTVVTAADTINFVGGIVTVTESPSGTARVAINIPEVTTDPVSPAVNDSWVLATTVTGMSYSLLPFALLYTASSVSSYQFSYKSSAGAIVRVTLS